MTDHAALRRDLEAQIDSLRSPEGYLNAGLPHYDHLFGRDACVSALQLLEYDPLIARATLQVLARYQGQRRRLRSEEFRGKMPHEHFPGGWRQRLQALAHERGSFRKLAVFMLWRFPYYGTVDAGGWYLILLHAYWRQTGDAELVRQLWPAVEGIGHWLRHHAQHTRLHLVGFRRHYLFGLRNQSWKDNLNLRITAPVAMVEVQGYYYQGFNLMAELAETVLAEPALAGDYLAAAARLKIAFAEAFTERDGTLPLAVNGRGSRLRITTSNPGHLLLSGILEPATEAAVVARLFAPDLWTPYGIRTEATGEPTFDRRSYHHGSVWPFDNWVIHQGLVARGYAPEAERVRTALLAAQAELGYIPELYGVTAEGRIEPLAGACRVQAWSAGALYNLLTESGVV
jgi:glycogen debranching enzyme